MSQRGVSKFHALRPPAISIKDYLQRVAKYAACSGECFVLALVYIDRIIQSNPTFVVNSLNIHRLLITSIMLAAKFFDDQYTHTSLHTPHTTLHPLTATLLLTLYPPAAVCAGTSTTRTTLRWAVSHARRSTRWR